MSNKKSVEEIEEIFPGFKEKYNQALKNGKITQEVAQMIADANILDRETIQKQKIKEAWKEKIENGNISTKDTQHLVNVIYGTEKELKSPQQEDPEHKEFREELQQYVYTPEQAAKNTAVREQKEIQEQQKQAPTQEEQNINADQPII
ncbi:MAG: hypothetical protein IKD74_00120 [Clostridia bacterium]|nr:hypothetical protein [Clostridia bacterium]